MLKAGSIFSTIWVVLISAVLCEAQTINDPDLQYRIILGGLGDVTTNMAFIGPDDILILRKNTGEVVRVLDNNFMGPVLDVNVNGYNGRGLLGITLHPNFSTNGFVYLYYTKSTTGGDVATNDSLLDNRVERYTWNGVALVNPTLIVSLPADPQGVHVGGIMTFGPDGKLYVVIGFDDRNGKLQNNIHGADPDDTGVVLRLNDDGTLPTNNPFYGQGGNLRKYFAYGIRNSFGMAFDPLTGELWMTDNGDENYDEINLVLPGFNSGWGQLMGPQSRTPGGTDNLYVVPGSQYADPKFSWFDSVAPTAILFFNSLQLGAQYQNNAFVADYNSGRIYRFRLNAARDGFVFQSPGLADWVADDDTEVSEVLFGFGLGLLTDLKISPSGKLYLLRLDGTLAVIESLVSNQDTIPPAAVSNLAIGAVTTSSVVLSWTAPGDDGNSGNASSYDVRYSTSGPIIEANWGSAAQASGEPAPLAAGSVQSFTVTGLSCGTTYYFALKTSDEVPNPSLVSNSPSAAALACPDTTPPDTSITSGPTGTITTNTADFTWTGSDNLTSTGNLVYAYRLDPIETSFSSFGSATSKSYTNLANGSYTFNVKAQDQAGIQDPSPANRSFIVSTGPSLNVSPSTAAPGGTVTAIWSGIPTPSPRDWIGLYAQGAPNTNYLDWIYVSCTKTAGSAQVSGSCPFVVIGSLAPGNYELRLLANNGYVSLASTSITTANLPVVTIVATDPNAAEAGLDPGVFTISRTGSTNTSLTVFYTVGGTATLGQDYNGLSNPGSVVIQAGQTSSLPITVTPIDDNIAEGNETVIVTLSVNAAYTVGSPANAIVTIVDNDTAPGPMLSVNPTTAPPAAAVTAIWSGIQNTSPTDWIGLYAVGASNNAYLDWIYVSCSKSAGSAVASGSCNFGIPAGLLNGNYELRLLSNNGFVSLATSNALTLGGPPLPVVSITATINAAEPATNGQFTVSRTGSTAAGLTVFYAVGGSATSGFDYQMLTGSVTIPAGQANAPSPVNVIDDNIFEGSETVVVTLSNNANYAVGNPNTATVTIADDEPPPAGPTLTVSPSTIVRGNSVTENWSGIVTPSATDWIGLYTVGAPDSPFWAWEYVSCTTTATTARPSGSCTLLIPINAPAGNFELRLFSNNTFTRLVTSNPLTVQ